MREVVDTSRRKSHASEARSRAFFVSARLPPDRHWPTRACDSPCIATTGRRGHQGCAGHPGQDGREGGDGRSWRSGPPRLQRLSNALSVCAAVGGGSRGRFSGPAPEQPPQALDHASCPLAGRGGDGRSRLARRIGSSVRARGVVFARTGSRPLLLVTIDQNC